MIPLPYATKENYKIMLYRLADTDADKVCIHFGKSALFFVKIAAYAVNTFIWVGFLRNKCRQI